MTKMATVHAQQMWEYTSVSRKTEDFLVNELNEAGKHGWELVGTFYHRDAKSLVESYCWTAIMKRPLVLPPQAKPSETDGVMPTAESSPATPAPSSQAERSIFNVRASESALDNGNDQQG
jgi:hypothetical protein